jgi:hypothetical protein
MPRLIKTIFLLLSFTLFTQTAFSWDGTGHRVISAIAYEYLTPEAKQKIDALTALSDPNYPPLMRFLYTSTLPDQWRQNDNGQSASWHFINTTWSTDGTPTQSATTPNLVTVLQTNQSILKNPHATNTEKATALAYVIHLTEDAHQPLHCINHFSKAFPQGDKGGNLFSIRTKYTNNLHAYWDQSARQIKPNNKHYPFNNKQVLALAKAIQADYPKNVFGNAVNDFSVKNWTAESYTLAQQKVYDITQGSTPSAGYKKMQKESAARQMALAGYRLAGLLNQLF